MIQNLQPTSIFSQVP